MSRYEAGPAPLERSARTGGRHRKPSSPGPATAIITTGTFAIVPFVLSSGTAQAAEMAPSAGLDAIATCESGGNPHAQNAGSTASGLYQFLDSSWKAYGGAKYGARAKDATPAQQTEIATSAVARSGLTPWASSQHCWGGKVSTGNFASARHGTAEPNVTTAVATRRPGSAGKSSVGEVAGQHRVPRQRRSPESAGRGGTHTSHHGGSRPRTAKSRGMNGQSLWESEGHSVRRPQHKHLHPGEELQLPRAADLSLGGQSLGTATR